MSSSRCIGELMIASHAFKLRSHKESVDFLQSLTSLVATRRTRSGPQNRDRIGVQTFAGLGEIDLSRCWQLTGALGRTTELLGLSRDRQNRCQYADTLKSPGRPPPPLGSAPNLLGLSRDRQTPCQYADNLKSRVRPPQASPHNTPRAANP